MNKGFIFTMDAVLALIPIFIVLASVSALSSGTGLFLQSYILGGERIAQDVLATLDYSGAVERANITELNETLEKLIPSYFSYSYTAANLNSTEKFSITCGNIANTTDVMIAKRVGIVSSGFVAVVMPNVFARTNKDINQDEGKTLNSILYSLLGIDEIDMVASNYSSLHVTQQEWESIGEVTPTLGNLSAWWSTNNTLGYLVDRLIDQANAQGKTSAVSGLTKFRNRLNEIANSTTTIAGLKYDINDILEADLSTSKIAAMGASTSDVLLVASQSANAEREELNPQYSPITTIKGKKNEPCKEQRCDYEMNLTINIRIPTQIAALSVGKTFYASEASVNLSVFEINQTKAIIRNGNVSYNITSKASFNITNIYEQGAQIRIDKPHSIGYVIDGYGRISAFVKYTIDTSAIFEQKNVNFDRIDFQGVPIQKDKNIFDVASGNLNQEKNYEHVRDIAKDGDLEKIFDLLLFNNKGDEKKGYITVSDAGEVTKETFVTLKLWRE
ncbi:MAG: hypothetical protein QME59_01445 [Candidatus Hydrothermarchaeota archaeon]|nr:hypothetical protein [Candidatus Hydrothermarchaeota archaeon]